jgi:HEAT repeat protein
MGLLGGLMAAGIVLSVVYLFAHAAARTRGEAWRRAAQAAGVTDLVSTDLLGIETGVTGKVGMLRVTLERYQRGRHERGTRIVIDGLGHPSYEFALRKEGVGSAIEKAFGEREIEVGDDEFDRRVYIHGSPRIVHAVLDGETRPLVGDLIEGRIPTGESSSVKARVAVSDGALRAEIRERGFRPGGERLPEALVTLLKAALGLVHPDDVPARLAEHVRKDPLPQVRLSNLLTLTREYPDYDVTKEALRTACDDADPEVRLRAAVALGEEGRDVLLGLASSTDVGDARSARAVSALGEHLELQAAEGILREALQSDRRATARAAVLALGRIGGGEVVGPLAEALDDDSDDVFVAAAEALGATGSPAAEAPLIVALDREGPSVWPAVAEALGKVGTAAAVAPLREMAGRFPFDLGLRRASRQAIAEIQSRLTGARPGQLALADGESGQLSLAEESPQGQVSLVGHSEGSAEGEAGGEDETHWPTDETAGDEPASPPANEEPSAGSPPPPTRQRDTE